MRRLGLLLLLAGCKSTDACPFETLDDGHVRLFDEGRVEGRRIVRGAVAICESGDAFDVFRRARVARNGNARVAPERVDVLFRPEVDGVAIDRIEVLDGVVLVEDKDVGLNAWGHELVHVAIFERRTSTVAAPLPVERLRMAAEEGVADFVGLPAGAEVARPTGARASDEWSALALTNLRFDPHPLGARLARRLSSNPAPGPCLVEMLAKGTGATPAALVASWKRLCPPASKALDGWIPEPLRRAPRPRGETSLQDGRR